MGYPNTAARGQRTARSFTAGAANGRVTNFPQRAANSSSTGREKTTPHSLEAEQGALGAMLKDHVTENFAVTAVARVLLKAEDFYREPHRKIFAVMCDIDERGEEVALFSVVEELRRRGELEVVGGAAYLTAMIESCRSALDIESYAKVVIEKSGLRQMLQAGEQLSRCVYDGESEDAYAAAAEVTKWLQQIQHRQNAESTPDTITAAELDEMDFPAPTWTVPSLLPTGLFIFGGKIKMGKSWLAQSLAFAVAYGAHFLGHVQVEQGEVLYLALEDTFHRLKDRQRKVLRDHEHGGRPIKAPADLHYQILWPRADESGVEKIAAWLDAHDRAKLVVIDILQKFRPKRKSGGDLYEEDYEALSALKALADERGISILVLHHLSKRETDDVVDALLGTVGVGGSADGTWVLERKRNDKEATLHISGRDVEDDPKALLWDDQTFTWTILGDAEEVREKSTREKILAALSAKGETLSPSEIAEDADLASNTVAQTLRRMEKDGLVQSPHRGQYRIPPQYATNADFPPAPFTSAAERGQPQED
jgi:DNA-binding transcriptional ArsR family regulator